MDKRKLIISGIITGLFGLSLLFTVVYMFGDGKVRNAGDFLITLILLISSLSIILFVKWTLLDKLLISDLDRSKNELEILKKKIKQKELKIKLAE